MKGQVRSFLALSGLAATNTYLTDARPAWIWAPDGQSILWANAAGAAFFGARSVEELGVIGGLARAPARPHIARIAQSGSMDRDTIDRLRFYRGLRVMLLTCLCRRLVLPDGTSAALIVANEPVKTDGAAGGVVPLSRLIAGRSAAVYAFGRDGSLLHTEGPLPLPTPEAVAALRASGKRSPVFGPLQIAERQHDAALVGLDDGGFLVIAALEDAAPQGQGTAENAAVVQTAPLPDVPETAASAHPEPAEQAIHIDEPAVEGSAPTEGDPATAAAGTSAGAEPDTAAAQSEDAVLPPSPEAEGSGAPLQGSHELQLPEEPEPDAAAVPDTEIDDALEAGPAAETAAPTPQLPRFVFTPTGRPTRFAWQMDVERRFTFLSPEFSEVLGPAAADIVGSTWEEVAARFDLDRDGEIAAALARHDTWSGKTVEWPVEGAALRVPVDMAALPAFDRFRVFEGFRGFGVCRTADAREDPSAIGLKLTTGRAAGDALADEPPIAQEAAAQSTEVEAEPQPLEAAPSPDQDSARPVAETAGHPAQAAPGEPDPQPEQPGGRVADAMPSAEAGRLAEEAEDRAATDGEAATARDDRLSEAPTADELPAGPAAGASVAQAAEPQGPEALGETTEGPTTEHRSSDLFGDTTPPPQRRSDVGDRDQALADQSRPSPAGEEPATTIDADTSRLSRPEREAFRKIAEALGAAAGARAAPPPEATPPAAPSRDAADDGRPSEPAAEPPLMAFDTHDAADVPPEPAAGDEESADNIVPLPGYAEPHAPDVDEAHPHLIEQDNRRGAADMVDVALLDRLPIGVAVLRDRSLLYANNTLLELLGYDDLAALAAAGGLDAVFAEPEEWPVAGGEAEFERTMRVRLASGGLKPVKARLHAVPWHGGRALLMSFLDRHDPSREAALDRLHETQSQLADAEQQISELDAVLETATDGVLVLDSAGTILKVNRSAEALFGASREDMVGAALTHYLAPESHRGAADYLEGLAKNGVASVLNDGREVIGRVLSGGLIPLFMTIGRIGSNPDDAKFCAVLRDITQWKKAEEELTEAKRQAETASSQKSDFLAKISHEIRTPLNAIIGFSEVMMEERFGPIGNDRYKEYLRDVHNSGSHIMSLINDLLDLSKIEAGKLDLTFEAISANEIIRECVALMQPQANRERVIIRASLPTSVPKIVADGRSVRQIILNLLSNAIKFNQPGGQVIVSSAMEDSGEVVLRVRDTGVGMSNKDLQAAMEPFRQLHTARHGGGTGLGLPLTKALVEANRASFRIDSELSHGTLVEITFPPQRVLAE